MARLPAAERQVQIAEAALALLAEGGTAALTTAALGRAVGLRDASLFRHFPHKAAIVAAAVDRFEACLAESLDRPEADPLARLAGFFAHRQALLRARPVILRLAFNERLVEAADPADRPRVLGILSRSRLFLRACLAEARAAGLVRQDVPVDVLQWTVMGAMRGAALDPAADPDAVWSHVSRLLRGADKRSS
ncbi:MAG: TetR family transcriptional regulator [Myxococcales bacterium]|nr:TetR family transcriptional regulator [Myxococcales bacterium]MCB9548917.1 TetR family transcriptional regulator [Myxococcales bacterium]